MFAALIARTDIDFIALDKGEMTARKAVDLLMDKMEGYANWGFDFIKEKWKIIQTFSLKNHHFSEYSWI